MPKTSDSTDARAAAREAALTKARQAAEDLAAEGERVTARAVQARAGVMMAVALEAHQEYVAAVATATEVPEMPEVFLARSRAQWRDAYTAARDTFNQTAAGWAQRTEDLTAERDEAVADFVASETARTDLAAENETVRAELAAVVADYRARDDATRERHEREIRDLREQLDAARAEATTQTARAAAEAARADTLQAVLDRIQPAASK